jgi:hypothetical protein
MERNNEDTTCVLCDEHITNPLCPACLQEGVLQWLEEQGYHLLALEVSEVTRAVFANSGSTFCIRCDSCMRLCAYCYTKELFEVIRREPMLACEYLAFFSFDLEHAGWEREAALEVGDVWCA